ncbi:hypothetical protein F5877DRAFT_83387 [Lentinula edodes]|nr:hypothetical protein F5877DRAFT_83387 [Lentinula edodes]
MDLTTGLYIHYPTKKVGQAYTINEIRKVVTFLLSDASAPVSSGSFRSGDRKSIPHPTAIDTPVIKTEPKDPEDSLPQQVAALTQMMQQFVKENKSRDAGTREPRPDRTCPWDGCTSKVLKDCPDLADWVAKGRVERNERGFVQLKGGRDLPNETKYRHGLVKTRFERYFEENPSAKTWILDIPQTPKNPFYQGPSMLATAAAYTFQEENDPSEAAAVRDLIFKIETRRSTKERTVTNGSSTSPPRPTTSSGSDPQPPTAKPPTNPEPSKPIPPRTTIPTKPPKPIIREDSGSTAKRGHQELPILSPNRNGCHSRTGHKNRHGLVRLLEDMALLEPVLMLDLDLANGMYSAPVSQESLANFFTDFGDTKEGDGFYVARESHSIRAVNAIIGGRPAHCILDGGCSIVVMSDSACNAFGLAFDPEKRINLQSANGNTDWSLGLAKDVPFRFGDVVAFLQVQVVDSPAYDFILGRPFEILMQASYKNFLSGDQHLTLTDPNTHKTITIPTVPREPPRFRKEDSREYRV